MHIEERTLVIDIDGLLTNEIEGHDYEKRTPNERNCRIVRNLMERRFKIIFYTSRHRKDYATTVKWLADNKLTRYTKLFMAKPLGEMYFDDKAQSSLDEEVLCFSGGLDSLIAYYYLGKPKSIYVDLHTKYSEQEKKCINRLTYHFGLDVEFVDGPNLNIFEVGENAYISKRNMLLALIASYRGNKVYIVGIKGDNVEDKNRLAFKTMEYAFNTIQKESEEVVKIESPFWNKTKGELVKWFLNNVEDAEELMKLSRSCYSDSVKPCGNCPSCLRKWFALKYNKVDCDDWFKVCPFGTVIYNEYMSRASNGHYDRERCEEMIIADFNHKNQL